MEIGKKDAKTAIGRGPAKAFDKGDYVEHTIFYDVDNSARIARFKDVVSQSPDKSAIGLRRRPPAEVPSSKPSGR
jgi:betaine-aldehyde dehydrogenase